MTPIPIRWTQRDSHHPIPKDLPFWMFLKEWKGAWAIFRRHHLRTHLVTEWQRPPLPSLRPELFRGVWYWTDGPITADMVAPSHPEEPAKAAPEPEHLEDIDPSRSSPRGQELLPPYVPGRYGFVKVDDLLARQAARRRV